MSFKLYTLDNEFIGEADYMPPSFAGIVVFDNGTKHWYNEGKLHRIDGAACEYADGTKYWFINDKQVSEEQHKLLIDIMKLKGLL